MRNPWLQLRDLLREEKEAIIKVEIQKLLACLERKGELLKDPALKKMPLSPELRQEIVSLLQHNQMLLKAGLAFVEEAYQFLAKNMTLRVGYQKEGQAKISQAAQIIDGVV